MRILPGFFALNVASVCCQSLAWALNLFLLKLMWRTPAKMDPITVRFTIGFIVVALIYGISQALVQPFFIAIDGLGVTIAASFLHDSQIVNYIICIFLTPTYVCMIQLCAFNFLYKYAVTCSPKLRHLFNSRIFVGLFLVAFELSILTWVMLMLTVAQPTDDFREKVAAKLNDVYQTDFRNIVFTGMDNTVETSVLMTFGLLFSLGCIGGCFVIIFVCGYRIWRMVYSNKLSGRSRLLHKQTLKMLSLQTFNPFFFMILPAIVPTILLKTSISTGLLSYASAYFLMFFPVINPIIVIAYTREYKRAIIRMIYGKRLRPVGSLDSRLEQSTHHAATRSPKERAVKI